MIETTWNGAALARSDQVFRGGGLISHVPFLRSKILVETPEKKEVHGDVKAIASLGGK